MHSTASDDVAKRGQNEDREARIASRGARPTLPCPSDRASMRSRITVWARARCTAAIAPAAVAGHADLEALALQMQLDQLPEIGIVVDDENSMRHARSSSLALMGPRPRAMALRRAASTACAEADGDVPRSSGAGLPARKASSSTTGGVGHRVEAVRAARAAKPVRDGAKPLARFTGRRAVARLVDDLQHLVDAARTRSREIRVAAARTLRAAPDLSRMPAWSVPPSGREAPVHEDTNLRQGAWQKMEQTGRPRALSRHGPPGGPTKGGERQGENGRGRLSWPGSRPRARPTSS